MSQGRTPRKKHSGFFTSGRSRPRNEPTPLWQWIVGIPLLMIIAGGIGIFVYINYFHPDIRMAIQSETVTVAAHGADPVTFGKPRPWLAVRLDGKDIHIPVTEKQSATVRDGDSLVVRFRQEGGETMVMGWTPAPAPPPQAP